MAIFIYTSNQIMNALSVSDGSIVKASKILGCSPATIYNRMNIEPKIKEIVRTKRQSIENIPTKRCTRCKTVKNKSEFGLHKGRAGLLRYNSWCKECNAIFHRGYYVINKDKVLKSMKEYSMRPEVRLKKSSYNKQYRLSHIAEFKDSELHRKYNISLEDWNKMVTNQRGKCAICGCILDRGFNTHVDHCHTTGKIRGILCSACNKATGLIKNDIDIAKRMIDYLVINS